MSSVQCPGVEVSRCPGVQCQVSNVQYLFQARHKSGHLTAGSTPVSQLTLQVPASGLVSMDSEVPIENRFLYSESPTPHAQ